MKRIRLCMAIILVICCVLPLATPVSANDNQAGQPLADPLPVAISDTMAPDGINRIAGGQLVGQETQVGDRIWQGSDTFVFAGDNQEGFVTADRTANSIAGVPFVPAGDVTSIEADIKPKGSPDWFALGLSTGLNGYWSDGQLWMFIRADGYYNVWADKTNHLLGYGQASSFDENGFTHLKLEYDNAAKSITAWINGVKVVDEYDLGNINGFEPDIRYAGFFIAPSSANEQAIRNFIVRGEAQPLPDPMPVSISDKLGINDSDRTAGSTLNEKMTEIDGRKWEANERFVFAGDEESGYVTSSVNGTLTAGVPFVPASAVSSLEADMNPTEGQGWYAIGFGKGTDAMWYDGQVWMFIRADGYYNVWVNQARNLLGAGQAPSFNAEGFNHLKIEYDSEAHTVTAWINDVKVVNRQDISGIEGFAPQIEYAGFMFLDATAYGQGIKNFIVRGKAAPVPPEYPDDIVKPVDSDFPLGVFDDANLYGGSKKKFKKEVAELYAHGFDSIMLSNGDAGRDRSMFEATDTYGLKVYYNPGFEISEWMNVPEAPADPAIAAQIADSVVNKLKDHPSIVEINLSDEPGLDMMQKHVLLKQAFHDKAPDLKISTPLIGLDRVGPMFSAADLDALLIDVYPTAKVNEVGNFNLNAYSYPIWDFVSYIRKVSADKPDDKPLWIILQAHEYDAGTSRFSSRYPIPAEARAQNWLAIGEGATGIFWFVYQSQQNLLGFKDNPALYDEVTQLVRRVNPLRPILLEAKKDDDRFSADSTGNTRPYVSTLIKKDGQKSYVVAVNMDCINPQMLTVDSTQFTGQLKDLETGQLYTIGSSQIEFLPGDGKLFEVIPTHVNSAPSVQITSPVDSAVFGGNHRITVTATASDDEQVDRVEFYADGKLIGAKTSAPYRLEWKHVQASSYALTAVAIDNRGTKSVSAPVSIRVTGKDNLIANPSFEEGATGGIPKRWNSPIAPVLDHTVSRTGSASLKITGVMSRSILSQNVSLKPNTEYELSAWVKTEQVKGSGISLRMLLSVPAAVIHESETVYGTKGWTRIAMKFMMPANAQPGVADFYFDVPFQTGTVWIDDVSLVATGNKEISKGLIAHWEFDEASGVTAYDSSDNGANGDIVRMIDGTRSTSIFRVPAFMAGKSGSSSLYLTGDANYVRVPGLKLDKNKFTITAWIKPEDKIRRQIVFANNNISAEIENGQFVVKLRTSGTSWTIVKSVPITSGDWWHVAVIYEKKKGINLYMNGAVIGNAVAAAYFSNEAGDFYIGASDVDPALNYLGFVDDFRIYKRSLESNELTTITGQ